METTSILLTGVGGQGTILISKILAAGLASMGYDVKMSEIHGMSQRGGTVNTQIKYGKKVYAPNIGPGEADLIVSFEKVETLRALPFLKKGGTIITNAQQIDPMPVTSGACEYPVSALDELRAKDVDIVEFDALSIANEAGSSKAVNLVLMGVLAKKLGMSDEKWYAAIERMVKPAFVELNKKAFSTSYNM